MVDFRVIVCRILFLCALYCFQINVRLIDDDPSILNSIDDISFLKTYFKQWGILNNIYKAKEAIMTDSALNHNKNVNQKTFDRYFERLETALQNFLCNKQF